MFAVTATSSLAASSLSVVFDRYFLYVPASGKSGQVTSGILDTKNPDMVSGLGV